MKKTTLTLLFLLITLTAHTQFKRGGKEKIRVLKIAYITDKLELSEAEAQKFWPVYNKYDKLLMDIHFEERFVLKKSIEKEGGVNQISEEKAKNIVQKIIALEKKISQIKSEFFNKLSKVISYKKIVQLEISEKEFHRKLLRKYKGKHK